MQIDARHGHKPSPPTVQKQATGAPGDPQSGAYGERRLCTRHLQDGPTITQQLLWYVILYTLAAKNDFYAFFMLAHDQY